MIAFVEHKNSIQFGCRCFDRLLLNGLIQPFQQPERVLGFFNIYRDGKRVKRRLRTLAGDKGLDLRIPANQWTLWRRTRGTTADNIEYVRSAACQGELFALIAQPQSYVFQMLEDVLILKVEGQDQFMVREWLPSEG